MDTSRKKVWREEEQRLLERWNAASGRVRDAEAALVRAVPAGGPSAELISESEAARTEFDRARKHVARLKAEFSTGKRY